MISRPFRDWSTPAIRLFEIWGQPLTPEEYYIPECKTVNANCEFGQWHPQLTGLDSDYVLIYLAGQRLSVPGSPVWLYDLNGGGDESKKHWFATIGVINLVIPFFLINERCSLVP